MKTNQILLGDCRNVLTSIPADSIAACITDPPYNYEFIGRHWDDAEVERRLGRIQKSKTLVKNIPYGSGLAGGVRDRRWYERNRQNIVEYQKWCTEWGREVFRVCKAGAFVAVFNSTRTFAHIQVALEEVGFYARDCIVYRRHSGIPKGFNTKRKFTDTGLNLAEWEGWNSCLRSEWEAIALLQKPLINNYPQTLKKTGLGLLKTVNGSGSFQSNIFEGFQRDNLDKLDGHCTVKPLKLMKKLVELLVPQSENNIILDPFAGTGTTLLAALELGYPYIGIEVETKYVTIASKRLDAATTQEHLFSTR